MATFVAVQRILDVSQGAENGCKWARKSFSFSALQCRKIEKFSSKKLKIHFSLSIFSWVARKKAGERGTFLHVTLESALEDDEYLKVKWRKWGEFFMSFLFIFFYLAYDKQMECRWDENWVFSSKLLAYLQIILSACIISICCCCCCLLCNDEREMNAI